MATSPTPVMIGSPKTKRGKAGINILETEFLFTGSQAENHAAMPTLGSLADWMPASTSFPPRYPDNEIVSCDCDWLGGTGDSMQWLWRVSAQSGTDEKGGGGGDLRTPENLAKKVESSYSTKELHLEPIWWGIRKAEKDDTEMEPYKQQAGTETDKKKNNVDYFRIFPKAQAGSWVNCVVGDFVFKNASPKVRLAKTIETDGVWAPAPTQPDVAYFATDDTDSAKAGKFLQYSIGMVNAKLSPYGLPGGAETADPYTVTQGPDAATLGFAGQKCKVLTYSVSYYERNATETPGALSAADINSFWAGIQPSATPYGSTTKARLLRPMFYAEAGFWKALDNRVEEIRDSEGHTWAKITRTMEGAPRFGTTPWRWNVNRSFHTYWSW